MPLTKTIQNEILQKSQCPSLREDMRRMGSMLSNNKLNFDEAISFINQMNALANHARKPFQRMTGRSFIL